MIPPSEAHHPLRQTYLAQPLIPTIFRKLGTIFLDSRALRSLQVLRSRGVKHDLVFDRLVGGSEARIVDGEERELRGDHGIRVAFRHFIVSA